MEADKNTNEYSDDNDSFTSSLSFRYTKVRI